MAHLHLNELSLICDMWLNKITYLLEVRFIAKSMFCAHFNERTDKTDKIVAYFSGCSSSALSVCFSCLIDDLFLHKDYKQVLFAK